MGLSTTHDCWRGGYASFDLWRRELAHAADFPPLALMEGYYRPKDWWLMTRQPDTDTPKTHVFSEMAKEQHGDSRDLSYEVVEAMASSAGLPPNRTVTASPAIWSVAWQVVMALAVIGVTR
jgi:hypothetical protein